MDTDTILPAAKNMAANAKLFDDETWAKFLRDSNNNNIIIPNNVRGSNVLIDLSRIERDEYKDATANAINRLVYEFAPIVYTKKQIDASRDKTFHMYSMPKDKLPIEYGHKLGSDECQQMFRSGHI
jgi:hypothetical protein